MPYISKIVTSPQNDEIRNLAYLTKNHRACRKQKKILLEGIHLIESCLDAGIVPGRVYLNEMTASHPEVQLLLRRLDAPTVVIIAPGAVLAKATGRVSPVELLALCPRPQPRISHVDASRVMLEDIQDPGNLGTILRCAAAANVFDVLFSKGCVDVYSPKVLRAGMGAHFVLNIHEQADLCAELARYGHRKVVAHLGGQTSLYAQDLRGPVAFVFGNEGSGVSAAVLALADARVRIPMPGRAESLNVAMAAAVCLFERVRQLEVSTG